MIASRGSIIPLFIEQIKKGATNNNRSKMTRYLMSLDDAVDLVLYAFQNKQEICLFKNLLHQQLKL